MANEKPLPIFINYRHDDSEDITHRIDASLCEHFGADSVYIDFRHFPGGSLIEEEALRAVDECEVFLPIIGRGWLEERGGMRRLDAEEDLLRREIERALESKKHILPIRVHDRPIPNEEELPETIRQIVKLLWRDVRSGADYENDLAVVIEDIANHLEEKGISLLGPITLEEKRPLDEELKKELALDLAFASRFDPAPSQAERYVIFSAIPISPLGRASSKVLPLARNMLDSENWMNADRSTVENPPPKYWPKRIFIVPPNLRSGNNSLVWEWPYDDLVLSRLLVQRSGEVFYASSIKYVQTSPANVPVFGIGSILADLWRFAGLVAQFNLELKYSGPSRLCVDMVNTLGSHLGDLADNRKEPTDDAYWQRIRFMQDLSCHTPNIGICRVHNLLEDMQPKVMPDFVQDVAEDISLAYNTEKEKCFEAATGEIPDKYFNNH